MKVSILPYVLLAAVPSALAQNWTFLEGLINTLEGAGCTTLTGAASQLNSSDQGKSLLATLSSGEPYVLFAPDNTAFSNAPSNLTSDITDLFAYHIVSGNFSGVATTYPNVTLGRTFLNDTQYVQLEGNKSQVLAWAIRSDGKTHVLNQVNDSTVTNTTTYGNVTINVVSSVLSYPASFTNSVPYVNSSLTSLESTLSNVSVPFYNSSTGSLSNASVLDVVNSGLRGFTLFAPNNSALAAIQNGLATLESNTSLLQIILDNHLINGTSVYSPELVGQSFVSAAGEALTFAINETGQYVTSGNTTAQIVQPDVLLRNGVVHVIDRVLFNTEENASAASSAAASATSAAAHSTTETRPIGYSQTATLDGASGAGASSTSASKKSSATSVLMGATIGQMVAAGLTALGIAVGGLMTFG